LEEDLNMTRRYNFHEHALQNHPDQFGTTVRSLARLFWRYSFVIALALAFSPEFASPSQAQSRPGAGTQRNFTLWGDVKVDESQREERKPLIFDVILYTRGNDVFARQRVSNNGRFRFNNIFNGDYYLAIELDSIEINRIALVISGQYADDIKQDIELEWRAIASRTAGVVSVADSYQRSANNKALYQKSTKDISSKKYSEAIATLRELVAADPKDFPAWSDLGMVYFIQKDLEEAEKSFVSAAAANPSYFPALLSMGRIKLARKNYEGAVESLEAALKIDPKSGSANYFLGEAYLQLKKGSKAVGYLNEALVLDPIGMAEAHLRLATLYNGAGYKDRAAAEYEAFLKKKPDYAERKKLEEYIAQNKKK
jgi:tetratricopeptide (TPR) repeat protein